MFASSSSNAPNSTTVICSATPTTFNNFEKLPIELREFIWTFAIPRRPRIIKITAAMVGPGEEYSQIKAEGSTPLILHACLDSRVFGLKSYKLLSTIHPNVKQQYIDFSQDTIYAKDIAALGALVEPIWSRAPGEQSMQRDLRHLMLGEDIGLRKWSLGYLRIRRLDGLKTITLTFDTEDGDEDPGMENDEATRSQKSRKAICKKRPQEEHPDEIVYLSSSEMEQRFLNGSHAP